MEDKRKGIVIFVFIALLILTNFTICSAANNKEMPANYQKVKLELTKIAWTLSDHVPFYCENLSVFDITVDFTIINMNDYTVNVTYSNTMQFFIVNVSTRFRTRSIEMYDCYSWSAYAAVTTIYFEKGISYNSVTHKYGFNKLNLTTLPDGEYIFWITLLVYGEEYTESSQIKLTIKNGNPYVIFNYTPLIALKLRETLIPFLLTLIVSIYYRIRKNKSIFARK